MHTTYAKADDEKSDGEESDLERSVEFFGDAFDADDCDTCADDGMLGAMAGWAGTFAALHAVRVLLVPAMGEAAWGTLHLLDGLAPAMRAFRIAKDPGCRACGSAAR